MAPLLLKRMLPVWLALENVAYAEEAPHMVSREHAQEVNDRGAALRLIRDELQVMAQIRNGCTLNRNGPHYCFRDSIALLTALLPSITTCFGHR